MTPNENQIDVLINYNDNIDKVTKHIKDLDTQIKTMQSNISKASNNNYNQQKGLILAAQQKIKLLQSELKAETNNLNTLTKLRQDQFVKELKNTHELANSKTEANKKFKAESEAFAKWGTNFNKQQLAEELAMYKTNQRLKTAEAVKARAKEMADKRAEDRTWKGAWFGSDAGSTFGHKFLTTAQYAIAGTALFGVASAAMSLGQAALEADLNMRTMSAVLKLNITEATALDEKVRQLGETYGGTTNEIEQVAIALGRAGIASKDITKATEITLAMARLTGDTFEQSASAVISYQQVFGNTTSIQTLGDKLAYVANVSRLSTQDIGTFSNYALAAAKDVGLTEDAVGGLAAAFSNAGVNASTIGTQIRRFTTLLTDDSEAVTNFYRTIGVNQKNLLSELQKGGPASNKALLDFVNQLKSVDKVTFTQLTGQMDILAANSLQLMRNNTANINKFVSDLQTGMTGQLDNTKVILDSYVVTFESMWNKIKNISSKGLLGLQDDITQISRLFDIIGGEEERAALKGLKIKQDIDDKALAIHRENYSKKLISYEDLDKYEQYFMDRRIKRENETKDLIKSNSTSIVRTKQEEIANLDKMIEATDTVLFNEASTKKELDTAKRRNDEYIAKKKELIGVIKDEAKANIIATTSISIDDNIKSINTLMNAKQDYSKVEQLVQSQVKSNLTNNNELIGKQIALLKGAPELQAELTSSLQTNGSFKSPYEILINSSTKYEEVVKRIKTLQDNNADGKNDSKLKSLGEFKNILAEVKTINSASLKDEEALIDLNTKKLNLTKQTVGAEDAARRKAEVEAERLRKYDETKVQLLTSSAELQAQINKEEDISLDKAESRFRVDTQLLGLAYEKYQLAKGTAGEKAAELTYLDAENKYFKSSITFINKQVELEEKRKSLSIELNSSLTQAIEGEQVRLGIIEKSTDSEYEKLRVKIEQGKLDNTLVGNELIQAERRLAELKVLQSRKKDVHTLAMEYQRELQDQETMGYIAAKAGLASLESGMMNFFDVTSEGWLDWHSLASSVLTDIYKQLLQQLVIKQLVSGIAGGISSGFGNVGTAMSYGTNIGSQQTAMLAAQDADFKVGGIIPTKGYASGGILSGGTGIRDDIYLGNVSGTRVFAMGGEFITRKSSVNDETKGTLDYINKTGTTPSSNAQVNVPVKINIENNTGQNITADMIESMTKPNDKGEYEKVVSIILKASQTDPRVRSMLKGR